MLQYVKADLYRLRHKTANYFFWGGIYALFIVLITLSFSAFTSTEGAGFTEGYFQMGILALSQLGILLIGGHCYYVVFLDDLSAKNYPNVFSTGLTKVQFVFGKMIIFIIQLIVVFLASAVVFFGYYGVMALFVSSFTFDQELFYLLTNTAITVFLGCIGYGAIGSLVAFWKQNSTLSTVFIFLLMMGMFTQIINLLAMVEELSFLETIGNYTLSSYLSNTFQVMVLQLGMPEHLESLSFMEIFGETWIISIIYMIVSLILSIVVLRKVEIKENN